MKTEQDQIHADKIKNAITFFFFCTWLWHNWNGNAKLELNSNKRNATIKMENNYYGTVNEHKHPQQTRNEAKKNSKQWQYMNYKTHKWENEDESGLALRDLRGRTGSDAKW